MPVARKIEHKNVEPVRCTEAIASSVVVGVLLDSGDRTLIFWQVALIASWLGKMPSGKNQELSHDRSAFT